MSKNKFDLIVKKKKEICIGLAGAVLLGGIGFSVAMLSGNEGNTSVVESSDGHVHDENCNHGEEENELASNTDDKENKTENTDKESTDKKEETSEENKSEDKESTETEKEESSSSTSEKNKGVNSESTGGNSNTSSNNNSSSNTSGSGTTGSSSVSNVTSKPSSGSSSSSSTTSKPSSGSSSSSSSSKPSSGSSSSGSSSGSSSSSSSGSSSSNSKPQEVVHNWVPITTVVHHDEVGHWEEVVVSAAWTETVPVYEESPRSICNGCGLDITGNPAAHIKEQMLAGNLDCGGYHIEYKQVQTGTNTINHPAVTEKKWVVDKAAWDETVTTGYKCTIHGETK